MREIKIVKWEEGVNGEVRETSTINMLNILINLKTAKDEMPKGMDNFRLMNRVGTAFDKAEKTGVLKLEEGDYIFLKKAIENDIPSAWGMNKHAFKAVDTFLKAGGDAE